MSSPVEDLGKEQAAAAVPVLMYHSIGTGPAAPSFGRFVMDPGEFAAQMDYLAASGYCPVTAADLAASRLPGGQLPARPVVLTFDDAFTDFSSAALPILRGHGFRATVYVPTAYVGATAGWMAGAGEGDRAILSWRALRDLAVEGVEVASHSHTHPQLDRVPPAVLSDEVRRSKGLLEDNLGIAVEGFAYPFGYWNRAARGAVAAAGFRYGCAVDELMAAPADDVLTLPRLTVNAGTGPDELARLLGTRPGPGGRGGAAAKRVAWRTLRRTLRSVGGDPQEGRPA